MHRLLHGARQNSSAEIHKAFQQWKTATPLAWLRWAGSLLHRQFAGGPVLCYPSGGMSASDQASFKIMGGNFREKGPIDWSTLVEWAHSGEIQPTTWIWSSADRTWRMAVDIPALLTVMTPTPLMEAMTGRRRKTIFGPRPSEFGRTHWEAAPTSILAVTAFLCGILGLWIGPFALAALLLGHAAQWRFRRTPPIIGGFALALYGVWMGYLAMALLLFDLVRRSAAG